jgi:hypothetical protein
MNFVCLPFLPLTTLEVPCSVLITSGSDKQNHTAHVFSCSKTHESAFVKVWTYSWLVSFFVPLRPLVSKVILHICLIQNTTKKIIKKGLFAHGHLSSYAQPWVTREIIVTSPFVECKICPVRFHATYKRYGSFRICIVFQGMFNGEIQWEGSILSQEKYKCIASAGQYVRRTRDNILSDAYRENLRRTDAEAFDRDRTDAEAFDRDRTDVKSCDVISRFCT